MFFTNTLPCPFSSSPDPDTSNDICLQGWSLIIMIVKVRIAKVQLWTWIVKHMFCEQDSKWWSKLSSRLTWPTRRYGEICRNSSIDSKSNLSLSCWTLQHVVVVLVLVVLLLLGHCCHCLICCFLLAILEFQVHLALLLGHYCFCRCRLYCCCLCWFLLSYRVSLKKGNIAIFA